MGIVVVVVRDHVRFCETTVTYALDDMRISGVVHWPVGKLGWKIYSSLGLVQQHWEIELRDGSPQEQSSAITHTIAETYHCSCFHPCRRESR